MDITVGVRRSVVEHKQGFALVVLHQLTVLVIFFPCFQEFRLPLGQSCPHGKVGLG